MSSFGSAPLSVEDLIVALDGGRVGLAQVLAGEGEGAQGLLRDESEFGGEATLRVPGHAQTWMAAPCLQGLVVHQARLLRRLCAAAVVGRGVVGLGSAGCGYQV